MEAKRSKTGSRLRTLRPAVVASLLLLCVATLPGLALAQDGATPVPTPAPEETPLGPPDEVQVEPRAQDAEIQDRLQSILEATIWFIDPQVRVQDGVVFLQGKTQTADYRKWAGDLARSTEDVAAVVNQIQILEPPFWDFQPALTSLRDQGRDLVRALPLILFSLAVLAIAVGAAWLAAAAVRRSLRPRDMNRLLVNVLARGAAVAVFLLGLYLVFQVAGLTNVALTVLGGTGLLGLILGIAFRDITENFLASIFLSMQNPFRPGDLVEITGVRGRIQALTTRTTVLMTLDGNHVQIPNATVYKSNITNYTSNPNQRLSFTVGIGYNDSAAAAQELALEVLTNHPAVLKDPEPWVLVENLGTSTVDLRVYFWLDGTLYSWQKVRSSVIRLIKRAFQSAGISMPGETRELTVPGGITVQLIQPDAGQQVGALHPEPAPPVAEEPATVSTAAEDGLTSDAEAIEEQARRSRTPEEGEDLLQPSPDADR